jgi:hypothetical protein
VHIILVENTLSKNVNALSLWNLGIYYQIQEIESEAIRSLIQLMKGYLSG